MADAPDTSKTDYRSTVPAAHRLPDEGLPQKEPGIAERWEREGLYQQIREAREGREKFISTTARPTPTATSTSAMRSTTR